MIPVTITQGDRTYILDKEGGFYKIHDTVTKSIVLQDKYLVRIVDAFFSRLISVDGLDYPQLVAEFVPYPTPRIEPKKRWWRIL